MRRVFAGCTVPSRRNYSYRAPVRDVQFIAHEVFRATDHYKALGFKDVGKDTVDMVITEVAKFAEQVLAPLNNVADHKGAKWVSEKEVQTTPGFKEAYQQYIEGGWQGLSAPAEYGGQDLPTSLNMIKAEMIATANWTWGMFPGLSMGSMNTLLMHGSDHLKKTYLTKLTEGTWTGTMCLTEPQCGSDLAQVKTRAEPQPDGTYKIYGTKIFISCGDHDFTPNVVHSVLARLPGAPEGTKGISLFCVPKYKVEADGSLGAFNNVKVGRLEEKMGCHGSPTAVLNFDGAEGHLIGQPNRGLNHMFTYINTSRIGASMQGVGSAELSFQKALAYAKERLAMRSLSGPRFKDKPADPIIVHPDIRRMLLTQKAIAEGGRAMVFDCALIADKYYKYSVEGDKKKAKDADEELAVMTPILKGFLTELGLEAANAGIQIWGGHGYIKDNGMEQIVRDARISTVWEGTTGIQSLDLLGRKILAGKGKPFILLTKPMFSLAFKSLTNPQLAGKAAYLLRLLGQWTYLTAAITLTAARDREFVGAAAVDYLMFSGYVTMGYYWLRMYAAALDGIAANPQDKEFYESKMHTADFYFARMLPRTKALAKTMMAPVKVLDDSLLKP
eukprot:TRINITY_DN994_c0_g1_i1.p1 TRINITY_DN994_c0_g1~~TRINITY_DN994_c0_g1_i1.p1  ORF type:complete len:623 (-),score=110.49 TRINITY_DN994_c0_g1_i1:11-1852(-)